MVIKLSNFSYSTNQDFYVFGFYMIIRKIRNTDVESISKLHIKVFDKSYFSVYYTLSDLSKYFNKLLEFNEYSYVCEDNNTIFGYLIGGFRTQEAVNIFLKENRIKILYYIFRNPKFIVIAINKLFKKTVSQKLKSKVGLRLFLIGVDPSVSKKGVGAQLVKKFEEDIVLKGFNEYGLYVRTDNQKAISFYLNRGFVKEFKNFDLFSFTKLIN